MKRYISKTVMMATIGLLVLLIACQNYAIFSTHAKVRRDFREGAKLRDEANTNDLPAPAHEEAEYSGAVFNAWSKLPPSRPLDAWDFYPDKPLP